MSALPSFVHPLAHGTEEWPTAFTFPFRYTPHPLCQRAALIVQDKLREMGVTEGKMYGVLVVRRGAGLYFLAAYSGQMLGSYNHSWFVPPVVDYLDPDCYFQKEQGEIVEMGRRIEKIRSSEERKTWQERLAQLTAERDSAVAEAKRVYNEGKEAGAELDPDYIRLRQFQKANIQRAKRMHRDEIVELEGRLAAINAQAHELYEMRRQRSEALQDWLFEQFVFLNGRGERMGLKEIFSRRAIPSGAGECCAPKLLQAAYQLCLEPLAMAEFWWGTSKPDHYREPGAFFAACHNKCYPILGHMLKGLNVEPDPAIHYEQVLGRIEVVWEDEHLAVVNKPNGWCSIPGRSDQANLFDEAHRMWPDIEGSIVVHRLDQDTSGLMVIAKNVRTHRSLSIQFERREVKKRYVAILDVKNERIGNEKCTFPSSGVIQLPIGPDLDNMPRRRVDWEHGKEAVTLYEVLGEEERGVRVAFYPQTGRTHQLRIHSASPEGLNAPIVGDRLYGQVADRLYLHAEAIDFEHPVTNERMHFEVKTRF